MDDLWPITSRVLGVFLVMAAGAACRQARWLSREADRSLANLTANLLLPALFFDRVLASPHLSSLAQSWLPPAIGFAVTVFGFGAAALLVYLLGPALGLVHPSQRRAFILCVGICNYGYIPLPLAEYFYPDAVVTLMVHNVGVDLALWSVGILIISGGHVRGQWRRALLSPPLLAVALALLLKQLEAGPWLPAPLLQMTHSLGQCAIPLGLVLSGAIIVDYVRQVRLTEGKRVVAAGVVLRLLLLPLAILALAGLAPLSTEMRQVLLLQAAMPAATFPIVLVRLYDQDTSTALRVTLGTSLVAIVTIPLWIYVGELWLQLV